MREWVAAELITRESCLSLHRIRSRDRVQMFHFYKPNPDLTCLITWLVELSIFFLVIKVAATNREYMKENIN